MVFLIFGISVGLMKKEIIICLGSSCFSRGNKKLVQVIRAYLDEHLLSDEVVFRGAHCFNMCEKGPVMKIDGKEFTALDEDKVLQVLEEEIPGNRGAKSDEKGT